MELREYREETKSLGGQRSSAVALTVGAAKARTHSGKQSFYFVVLKGGCLQATRGRGEMRFHCLCDISESVIGSPEHVRSVGWRKGLLWKPQEWRSVPCLATVDQDECVGSLKHQLSPVGPGYGPAHRTL